MSGIYSVSVVKTRDKNSDLFQYCKYYKKIICIKFNTNCTVSYFLDTEQSENDKEVGYPPALSISNFNNSEVPSK